MILEEIKKKKKKLKGDIDPTWDVISHIKVMRIKEVITN